jgi:hypothetical protein
MQGHGILLDLTIWRVAYSKLSWELETWEIDTGQLG